MTFFAKVVAHGIYEGGASLVPADARQGPSLGLGRKEARRDRLLELYEGAALAALGDFRMEYPEHEKRVSAVIACMDSDPALVGVNVAHHVLKRLVSGGSAGRNADCVNMLAGPAGFIDCLNYARYGIGGERLSFPIVVGASLPGEREEDGNVRPIAGAMLLEGTQIHNRNEFMGYRSDSGDCPPPTDTDGFYEHALESVPRHIELLLEPLGGRKDGIHRFVIAADTGTLRGLGARMQIPNEKLYLEGGDTPIGAASLPVAYYRVRQRMRMQDTVVFCSGPGPVIKSLVIRRTRKIRDP